MTSQEGAEAETTRMGCKGMIRQDRIFEGTRGREKATKTHASVKRGTKTRRPLASRRAETQEGGASRRCEDTSTYARAFWFSVINVAPKAKIRLRVCSRKHACMKTLHQHAKSQSPCATPRYGISAVPGRLWITTQLRIVLAIPRRRVKHAALKLRGEGEAHA